MKDNPHLVTPEEADRMACPMRMNRPEFTAACIGTICMAWRWKEINDWDEEEGVEVSYSTTHGYCGMVPS